MTQFSPALYPALLLTLSGLTPGLTLRETHWPEQYLVMRKSSHLCTFTCCMFWEFNFFFFFQLRTRDMKSIYLRRALSLATMQFSNAQFPVLYLILCLWSLGLTLRPTALVRVFWVKIVVGIFPSVVNSIKDIYFSQSYSAYISVSSQRYEIDILRESVILGNDALFKCSIPSFVSDFVSVDSWVDSEANNLGSSSLSFGNFWYFNMNRIQQR